MKRPLDKDLDWTLSEYFLSSSEPRLTTLEMARYTARISVTRQWAHRRRGYHPAPLAAIPRSQAAEAAAIDLAMPHQQEAAMSGVPENSPGIIQDAQYSLPYHYLPRLHEGRFSFHAVLQWGHEYLSYMNHVVDALAPMQWRSMLDVGCGDGRLLSLLRDRVPDRDLAGLDYSERAIALARAMVPGVRFVAGDVTREDLFDSKFDCATCIETLEHIDPSFLGEFVRGIRSQMKDDGTLIVTVPSTNLPLNRKHFQHFTEESLSAALNGPFEIQNLSFLNGSSSALRLFRTMVTNRIYTVTDPRILTAFYRYYVRNHLRSDQQRGSRLMAIARAT